MHQKIVLVIKRRSSLLGNQQVHDKKNDFVSAQLQKLGVSTNSTASPSPRRNSIERRASVEFHQHCSHHGHHHDHDHGGLQHATTIDNPSGSSGRRASLTTRRASLTGNADGGGAVMDFSSPPSTGGRRRSSVVQLDRRQLQQESLFLRGGGR